MADFYIQRIFWHSRSSIDHRASQTSVRQFQNLKCNNLRMNSKNWKSFKQLWCLNDFDLLSEKTLQLGLYAFTLKWLFKLSYFVSLISYHTVLYTVIDNGLYNCMTSSWPLKLLWVMDMENFGWRKRYSDRLSKPYPMLISIDHIGYVFYRFPQKYPTPNTSRGRTIYR